MKIIGQKNIPKEKENLPYTKSKNISRLISYIKSHPISRCIDFPINIPYHYPSVPLQHPHNNTNKRISKEGVEDLPNLGDDRHRVILDNELLQIKKYDVWQISVQVP